MSLETYKIVFTGNFADGKSRDDVKSRLMRMLSLSDDKAEALLVSRNFTIKKNLPLSKAKELAGKLNASGAVFSVVKENTTNKLASEQTTTLALEPKLELMPKPPKKSTQASETEMAADSSEPDEPDEADDRRIIRALAFALELLWHSKLFIFGLLLIVLFSPVPHGVVKNGFCLGVIIAFLGFWRTRRQFF